MSNKEQKHNHGNHMWMMVLCCLIPVVLLALVSRTAYGSNGIINTLLPFLCPLMMIIMMIGCFKKSPNKKDSNDNINESQSESCH